MRSALGDDVADAQVRAYADVDKIRWRAAMCQCEIGCRAVNPGK